MSVLCKFAYELTLGLLHSCSPNVRKKKGYRMAKPGLFFAIFFSKCYFSTRSFICTCGKRSLLVKLRYVSGHSLNVVETS